MSLQCITDRKTERQKERERQIDRGRRAEQDRHTDGQTDREELIALIHLHVPIL
jgi:hypothetical protein